MASAELDPAAPIARSPEAVFAPGPPENFIMHLTSGRCVSVDDAGVRIWELLESPRSLSELVDRLAQEFSGDRDAIAADVRAFVLALRDCELALPSPQ
ncbi:MAG TPA: PqqD family protein [Thermoleophilaceae bacterium]|jgi:hypothetical protein